MALHWQELKGFYGTNSGDILYTYIKFQRESAASTTTNEISRPQIVLKKEGSTEASLGYILCNNVENYIEKPFIFHNSIFLGQDNFKGSHDDTSFILEWLKSSSTQSLTFKDSVANPARDFLTLSPLYFWMRNGGIELDTTFTTSGVTTGNGVAITCNFASFNLNGSDKYFSIFNNNNFLLHVGLSDNDDYEYRFTSEKFISNNPIQAYYFDATSDARAKENINLLTIPALKLVRQTPIYSFNYKESQLSSIGVLAQDLKDINIDGFDLVGNKTATGENNDYMQIHESKLIYVLWKAVQELSNEVDNLKKQLIK